MWLSQNQKFDSKILNIDYHWPVVFRLLYKSSNMKTSATSSLLPFSFPSPFYFLLILSPESFICPAYESYTFSCFFCCILVQGRLLIVPESIPLICILYSVLRTPYSVQPAEPPSLATIFYSAIKSKPVEVQSFSNLSLFGRSTEHAPQTFNLQLQLKLEFELNP